LSTALTLTAFLCALRTPVTRSGHAIALGILTALVALTQQPKGVGAAVAVVILFAIAAQFKTAY
jgi:4-amino-4-deoxy-L-arabinose transferase-like glycosyltransferase